MIFNKALLRSADLYCWPRLSTFELFYRQLSLL